MLLKPQLDLSNVSHLDCSVELALPLDFVIEWTKLSTKQTWIAHMKNCTSANECAFDSQDITPHASQHFQDNESCSTVVETSKSVLTASTGEQKAYVRARFTCVRLNIADGKLQMTVASITTNTDANTSSSPVVPTSVSPATPTVDEDSNQLQHGPETCRSLEALADCAGQILCPALLKSSAKHDSKSKMEAGYGDGCSSVRLKVKERGGLVSGMNEDVSAACLEEKRSSKDIHSTRHITNAGKDESDLTSAQSKGLTASVSNWCEDGCVHKAVTGRFEASDCSTLARTEASQSAQNSESGGAVKRKRGRPRKSNSAAKLPTLSHGSCDGLALPSDDQSHKTPHRNRYSLRGKKLPSSIFGDSGSEEESEAVEEEEEYCPPLKQHAGGRNSTSKQFGDEQSIVQAVVPHDQGKSDQNVLAGCVNQADIQTVNHQTLSVPDPSSDNTGLHQQDSVEDEQSSPLSSQGVPGRKKRGRPPCRKNHTTAADLPSKPKKQRIKIDVSGLPSFARRQRNKDRKASCKYCQRKFCDYTGVTMHVKKFHTKAGDLEDYLSELKKLSVVECSVCEKQFENRFQLQLHEDKVHYKVGEMQCGQCGKSFANMILVKQHIRSVHHVQGQGHACTLCPARFKWATTLKTHIAEVHHGIRDLACDVCGKKFHRRAQLNRHALSHGPEDAKLACHICGRKFSYPNNLQRHMTIVHGPQDETWHCAYCGKGFQRRESLHNHVEKVHYALFPYHCHICKAGFVRAVLLEKHMMVEHGEVGFQAPAGRRTHFKYNRSEGDELVCGICEEKCFYKAQLVDHVFKVHRDTFPFECDVCQQVFMERSFLVLHRKRAHSIQPEQEEEEFDVEGDSFRSGEVIGLFSENMQGNRDSLNPAKLERKKTLEDSMMAATGQSYIIKVESGDNMIEYIVQNPEGQSDVPSEAVVQNIANLLLATEQSVQENSPLGVVDSANDASMSAQGDINTESNFLHGFQRDVILNGVVVDGGSESMPSQEQTSGQRIFVQCGESIHELIPGVVGLEGESIQEELLATSENPGHNMNFVSTTPLLTDGGIGQQQIIITGGNIVDSVSVEAEEGVLHDPLGGAEDVSVSVTGQSACVSDSDRAASLCV